MTGEFTVDRRHQVEEWLDRPLTDAELVDAPALDKLSPEQLAVVKTLVHRNRLACFLYLRGVVEDLAMSDALPFMEHVENILPYRP